MFGMFFCFCYVIWTAILVVVRPSLWKEGGLKESYGELSIFFSLIYFFSLRWSVLFSCKRESLAFTSFSSVSRLRGEYSEGCTVFAAHAVECQHTGPRNCSSEFSLHSFQVVHASLYFFFQIKDHELYHVLCHFSYAWLWKLSIKDSITSLYVVYRLDKCVNNKLL